nr:uncharacterized protein LOC122270142 [Parasteatoda tepidariorum]
MHFISAAWRSVTQKRISHCFEESGIVASNEPLADAGLARLDPENDNETVSYDFDEYIRENLATCEAERTTAPSVDDVMDFSSADEDEQEGTEAQPVPSFNTALRSLLIVKDYFLSYEDQEKNLQKISVLEDEAFTLKGAPAMAGNHSGVVTKLKQRTSGKFVGFPCIIHQESLASKQFKNGPCHAIYN